MNNLKKWGRRSLPSIEDAAPLTFRTMVNYLHAEIYYEVQKRREKEEGRYSQDSKMEPRSEFDRK
jgi:hypothetical protein